MDPSLKELESRLEGLVSRGLSNEGRASCSTLLDRLAKGEVVDGEAREVVSQSTLGISWKVASIAASIALGIVSVVVGGWVVTPGCLRSPNPQMIRYLRPLPMMS